MFGASNSGAPAFGSTANTAPLASSGLFGAKPAQSTGFGAPQTQSSSLFGAPTQANSGSSTSTGGLFGAKPAAPATGGLFGAPASKPAPLTFGSAGSAPSASGGLFGSNNTTTNSNPLATTNSTLGGLFGTQSQNPTTSTSGGLFGTSTTGNASSTTTSGSGGLFGAKPPASTTPASGGLFGAKPATTGGLFGSQPAAPASGGLFGSQPAAPASGGLFGAKPAAPASGGLFGASATQNPTPATSGGLFGSNSQPQPANNINNPNPTFAWSQTQQPAAPTTNQSSGPQQLFQNTAQLSNQASNQGHSYVPAVNDQLVKIKEQWDPESSKCTLKSHFYNKLGEQEAQYLRLHPQQRPANETPEDWDLAMKNRPGPEYLPVKVTSFTEVAQRIEVQIEHVAKARLILNNINEKQQAVSSKHDLNNSTRILQAKEKHTVLLRRLLRLATVLAILKLKGYPLLPEEEEIAKQFDLLNQKASDPASSLGKLNDLFARLELLKDRQSELQNKFDSQYTALSEAQTGENGVDKGEMVEKITKLLLKQQMGLNYLNQVLEKDAKLLE